MLSTARQRRQRRSRSALLWMASVFVLGQALLGVALDFGSARGRFTALYRQLDLLDQVPHDPAIVCFGSSRTGTALIDVDVARTLRDLGAAPQVDVLNLWVPQGDLLTSECALQHLLRAGRRPQLAVIEVIPEYFHSHYDFLEDNVLRVLGWRETCRDFAWLHRKGLLPQVAEARLLPLFAYRNELTHGLVDWHHAMARRWLCGTRSTSGWNEETQRKQSLHVFSRFPSVAPKVRDARVQQWIADHRERLASYVVDRDSVAILERLLDLCESEGIRVFLWTTPLCSERRACYPAPLEEAFRAELHRLQARYHFDYCDARACLRDDQLRDTHHLTRAGAEQFSRQFARDLLAPAWARVKNSGPIPATPTKRIR